MMTDYLTERDLKQVEDTVLGPLGMAFGDDSLRLIAEIRRLWHDLATCYKLTGADPDGNEDWRLAPYAVGEVRDLRADLDQAEGTTMASHRKYYVVFDNKYGAIELEEKLNELAKDGYVLHNVTDGRYIMENRNVREY